MNIINNLNKQNLKIFEKISLNKLNPLNLSKITLKSTKEKLGKSPGTLVYTGKPRKEKVKIQVMDYTKGSLKEFKSENIEDTFKFKNKKSMTWINITGIHNLDLIKKIGEHFNFHPLILEDIVNTNQRPKIEEFDEILFLVLKIISHEDNHINSEQISIIFGKGFIISFQEQENNFFEPIKERIRQGRVRIRTTESDYLAYTLLDIIIDNYFVVLESIGDEIESIENNLIKDNLNTLNNIYKLKRELINLRKSIWPLREIISFLQRTDSKLIHKETQAYIRDVYDHTIQVMDTVETFRDMLSGMLDLYLSINSNKMNEVMKVLTIIATIFIPLTFIAGIYGMNFEYMPELAIKWFYPAVWGVIVIVAAGMIFYFKRKKWF